MKTDPTEIFVDDDASPYKFYLCTPLDKNERLVKMIRDHGGEVTTELERDVVVISGKEFELPETFQASHVYSYQVIEDSVKEGVTMEFSNYLVHVPEKGRVKTPTTPTPASPPKSTRGRSVNYFTQEEDATLLEEIRKRPWMGFKGHKIYKELSELPFFKNRGRTSASLRERVRTKKYDIKYFYKADANHRLLKDQNGEYIRVFRAQNQSMQFTAADDFILCKVIYLKLKPKEDAQGYETVYFPTNFYDKFHLTFPQHPSESWRQRYKNYLWLFGIANYLKYYLVEVQQDNKPDPCNLANRDWTSARKALRTSTTRLYFPNIPTENDFIDRHIEEIELPQLQGKDLSIFAWHSDNSAKRSWLDTSALTEFVDEPTTAFTEEPFAKAQRKHGNPINLAAVKDSKEEFFKQVEQILLDKNVPLTDAVSKLKKSAGIQKYYTAFILQRCYASPALALECIKNYVESEGKELLCAKPGIITDKTIEWMQQNDDHLDDLLTAYHGEETFDKIHSLLKRNKRL